jgi:hypothetical protein
VARWIELARGRGSLTALRGVSPLKAASVLRVFSGGSGPANAQVDALVHEPYELTEEDAMVERLS